MASPWHRRSFLTTAATALVAPVLAACGDDDNGGDSNTLTLGYFPNITHTPALVGVQNGIFAEHLGKDITLETATFNAGPSAIEALFSGAVDAAYIGPNPAVNGWAQSEGTALRIIAGSTSGGAALAVNPEIQSVDDLAGRKLASPQLGNTQDAALRYFLADNGFQTDTSGGGDVAVLPTPNAEVVAAFIDAAVDGAWLPEPHLSRLIIEGGAHILVDEADLWPNGQFVTTHLIVRAEFLDEQPDLVRRLLDGHIAAVDFAGDSPGEAQQAANAHLESLSGARLEDAVLTSAFANLEFTVDPIAASLSGSAEHAEAVGLLDAVDLTGIYALDPLNELLRAAGRPEVGAAGLAAS